MSRTALVTDVQESCVIVIATCNNLQQDFSCASFFHSRASFLYEIEHVLFDARNLQCNADWMLAVKYLLS